MPYPTEEEIRKRLRPYVNGLWAILAILGGLGFLFDLYDVVPDAFVRSGGVILFVVVAVYFYLENNEFLTGNPGNFIESDNHFLPRTVLGTTYFWVSAVASIITIFGDMIVAFFRCGRMEC